MAIKGLASAEQELVCSVWWPGLSRELEEVVRSCSKCLKERQQSPEPLIPSTFPTLPWQRVATDMFDWKASKYLLIVDYFSRYIEIAKLSGESATEVIRHTKSIFARHGIPQEVMSDNGPQFSSTEYREFAAAYGFSHATSSPRYPQSNGEAERAVKTVKDLLRQTTDPYMALLEYRSTHLQNGYSPAELLMSRRLRTALPMIQSQLKPSVPDNFLLREAEDNAKQRQKRNYDARHCVQRLDPLSPGEEVWIPDHSTHGTVVQSAAAPRSYQVSSPTGVLRRNQRHLIRLPEEVSPASPAIEQDQDDQGGHPPTMVAGSSTTSGTTVTRSGRVSLPPSRMDPSWN